MHVADQLGRQLERRDVQLELRRVFRFGRRRGVQQLGHVGSTGGKLYFLDRNTGTTPAVSILKEYFFGSSQSVSSIGYDPSVNRYMVTSSNASTNDGRVYFFDQVADPTSGSL